MKRISVWNNKRLYAQPYELGLKFSIIKGVTAAVIIYHWTGSLVIRIKL